MIFFLGRTVNYKGYLFIFGGFNGIYQRHFNDLLRFDPRK